MVAIYNAHTRQTKYNTVEYRGRAYYKTIYNTTGPDEIIVLYSGKFSEKDENVQIYPLLSSHRVTLLGNSLHMVSSTWYYFLIFSEMSFCFPTALVTIVISTSCQSTSFQRNDDCRDNDLSIFLLTTPPQLTRVSRQMQK